MKIKKKTAEKYWVLIGLVGFLVFALIMGAIAYVWDEVDSTLGGFLMVVFVFCLYVMGQNSDGNSGGYENGGDGGG